MYKPVSNKIDFPAMESEILAFWEQDSIFKKSLEQRHGSPEYVFYDGPPFATGLPHYGHLLAGTIKDIVPRYHTMRGHYVARRFGWDCHGLPIEALAQEALGLAGSPAIVEAGVDVFNEQCRSMVTTYVGEWRKTVTRMGRWVDFDNDYKTMDMTFMESIWWVFSELWKQGRIYRAHRIMPYSWKLNTPLSNFEAGRNYQDVQDPSITVRVKLKAFDIPGAYALVWTTTPWTLPSNLAICVGPDIGYVVVRDTDSGDVYVLAEARLGVYYPKPEQYEVLKRMKGSDLQGLTYEPLFDYFADTPGAFTVLADPFVSTEDGSGIVHMAPAYGEDDYRVCSTAGIPLVEPLDVDCKFTALVPDYAGLFCKDADKLIIKRLKDEGKLVHQSTIQHSYPFCERTDTPLIYRAIDAWYVRVEDLHDELLANNSQVHWMPGHVGEKRFANWLADAKDWNISRNRFWGSCIPVWINQNDPQDTICIASVAELERLSGQSVTDLHKHVLDNITISKDGETYRRTPEVLDCWFESGAMPYAQQHYPFENKAHFDANFPAHFIAEGLDQTRGWFYTLMVLSTALFKKPAFRNVVVNGLVLAENGLKMSKRLKNYPDPMHIINAYGADALRLYMINSPVVKAESLRFSEEGVKHAMRHLLIPLWNAYSFFVTYARIDGWTAAKRRETAQSSSRLDQWIHSSLETLIADVTDAMDAYDLQRAVRPFVRFIEDLTNWYIRRSRRRFWKTQDDADKADAYETLYTVLIQLAKVAAPFIPFMSEAIYRNLRTADMPESVHLCDFPTADATRRNTDLESEMQTVMTIVQMGRQLRADHNLKVRQPLAVLHVVSRNQDLIAKVRHSIDVIEDELNVKSLVFGHNDTDLANLSAKADFRRLGPRFGKHMKTVADRISKLEHDRIVDLVNGGRLEMDNGAGDTVVITAEDLAIERTPKVGLVVATEGDLVVGLETALDEALINEGHAREFTSKLQNMRKTAELEVTQRIRIRCSVPDALKAVLCDHRNEICEEVLALAFEIDDSMTNADGESVDINGNICRIEIRPVANTVGI
jgi:isoleucyl-tRNA synthetase